MLQTTGVMCLRSGSLNYEPTCPYIAQDLLCMRERMSYSGNLNIRAAAASAV